MAIVRFLCLQLDGMTINHFPCHVIALLCLPCKAAYQNQTGVGKDHGCKICIQFTNRTVTERM